MQTVSEGVTIYYPGQLQIKEGYSDIRILRRGWLAWSWLELEGAKALPEYS